MIDKDLVGLSVSMENKRFLLPNCNTNEMEITNKKRGNPIRVLISSHYLDRVSDILPILKIYSTQLQYLLRSKTNSTFSN